ncbi:UNVERIFIED_CONTAM: hypothetical protein NY100_16700, partial [Prevotella sp. 15_C9]
QGEKWHKRSCHTNGRERKASLIQLIDHHITIVDKRQFHHAVIAVFPQGGIVLHRIFNQKLKFRSSVRQLCRINGYRPLIHALPNHWQGSFLLPRTQSR